MWVVLRYKQSEIGNLKNDLISRIKDVVFYNPKIKLNYFQKIYILVQFAVRY